MVQLFQTGSLSNRGKEIERFPGKRLMDWCKKKKVTLRDSEPSDDKGWPDKASGLGELLKLSTDAYLAQAAIEERNARFQFGVAFTVFWEIEQAEMKKGALTGDSLLSRDPTNPTMALKKAQVETKSFRPPGEEQFRLVLRPTLKYRASTKLEFYWHSYFKFSVDDIDDWRSDVLARADLSLKKSADGDEQVGIAAVWEMHYDSRPPTLVGFEDWEKVMEPDAAGEAEKQHTIVTLEITVAF